MASFWSCHLLLGFFIFFVSVVTAESCFPRDCKEVFDQGKTCSGRYTIKPDELPAFEVYCDMSNGGGWTVFQRRMDGTVNFYLKWADYVKGFGDLNGEFWLGLNKIYRLTKSSTSLRIDLEDFEANKRYATYTSFKVGNAATQYLLTVSGYAGNAGDGMAYQNGMKFTTYDYDNDTGTGNCGVICSGAWWYKYCHTSNLNGLYLVGSHTSYANGVNWYYFKGFYYSLKTTEMKMRRN